MIPKHFHQDSQTSRSYHFPLAEQGKAVVIRAQATVPLWWACTPSPNSPHSVPRPFTLANYQPHLLSALHTLPEGNRHASLATAEPQLTLQALTQAGFLAKLLSSRKIRCIFSCSQGAGTPTTSFTDASSASASIKNCVSFLNISFPGLRSNNDLTVGGQIKST